MEKSNKNERKYKIEKYMSSGGLYQQAIEISLELDEKSNGLHSQMIREKVVPEFKLYEVMYLDQDHIPMTIYKYNCDGELISEENVYKYYKEKRKSGGNE